jgi:hypothetical protein
MVAVGRSAGGRQGGSTMFKFRRVVGLVALAATATLTTTTVAAADPPTVNDLDYLVGTTTFNPPENSCGAFGVLTTVVTIRGVEFIQVTRDGSVVFRTTASAVVRLEAAAADGTRLGWPQIEVLIAGMATALDPGNATSSFELAGRSLLGGLLVRGRVQVTFDAGNVVGFEISPNATNLCPALAP